jgi:hypothetical protein
MTEPTGVSTENTTPPLVNSSVKKLTFSPATLAIIIAGTAVVFTSVGLVIAPALNQNRSNPTITPTQVAATTLVPLVTDTPTNPTNTIAPSTVAPTAGLVDFKGKYVTAKLPAKWQIVESSDFSKTTTLSNTKYLGLATLDIRYNNKTAVLFRAGEAFGDTTQCESYAKFKDTSSAYVQFRIDTNKVLNMEAPQIIDLTNAKYAEYTALGNKIRRFENTLYFNGDTTGKYFNASCGLEAWARQFPPLSFRHAGENGDGHTYFMDQSIPSNLSETELLQFDKILQSIKAV